MEQRVHFYIYISNLLNNQKDWVVWLLWWAVGYDFDDDIIFIWLEGCYEGMDNLNILNASGIKKVNSTRL